jgi:ABC-type lipoprotein release transport system permease subunit
MSINRQIREPKQVATILSNTRNIVAYTPRIRSFCLFGSADNSVGGMVIGVDPTTESKVTKIHKSLISGEFLKPGKSRSIVLGKDLAENLGVGPGNKVILMGQARDGTLGAEAFRVSGLMKTGAEEIDKAIALISLDDLQEMLVLDSAVTDFVIKAGSFDVIEQVALDLRRQLPAEHFEVMTWYEISPILKQWIDFDEAFAYVFLLIVLVVIVAGILNTILMSLLERTREFGVMMSLGTKGYQLATTVGIESLMLGMLGMLGGVSLGMSVTYIFSFVGIPISGKVKEAMASFFMSDTIYPVLVFEHVFSSALIVFFCSVLISLYPAWKASRLEPVEALRHI